MSERGPSGERFFLDTNIAVYCFDSSAPRKQEAAKELVTHAASSGLGVVSYQVLQEFCNVASNSRRLTLDNERTMAYVSLLLEPMNKVAASVALLDAALSLRAQYSFSFYDSLIIAAAQQAHCTTLYSEDMQHAQRVGSLRIVNPFLLVANEPEVRNQKYGS
jgi:predicted nucleic acid-binding protein